MSGKADPVQNHREKKNTLFSYHFVASPFTQDTEFQFSLNIGSYQWHAHFGSNSSVKSILLIKLLNFEQKNKIN